MQARMEESLYSVYNVIAYRSVASLFSFENVTVKVLLSRVAPAPIASSSEGRRDRETRGAGRGREAPPSSRRASDEKQAPGCSRFLIGVLGDRGPGNTEYARP